jgi:biofilm PGA synthesis N-glycosyltransferase PgaC
VDASRPPLRISLVVPFLDEETHLPRFLASVAAQTRPPDRLLLVDDGSSDASAGLARAFAAEHGYATALERPRRAAARDRLAQAPELQAFTWATEQLDADYDVIAKVDADLDLAPGVLAELEAAFVADPALGLAGVVLHSAGADGVLRPERVPSYHVRGATKFYRRACLGQISPIPTILGWDTIDEVHARRLGWITRSFALDGPPTVHLRPPGAHDGVVRGFRRWGECAWAYGADPVGVLAGGVHRMRRRPYVVGGLNYIAGWGLAALRGVPRADAHVRAFCRQEQRLRMRRAIARRARAAA